MVTALLAFAVALGILITFHELGHYLVARLCGVKVLTFSFGFGPKLFSKRLGRDKTSGVFPRYPWAATFRCWMSVKKGWW